MQHNLVGAITFEPFVGVLQLKSSYKDGTTHIVMEPLEFMERLAALVSTSTMASDNIKMMSRRT